MKPAVLLSLAAISSLFGCSASSPAPQVAPVPLLPAPIATEPVVAPPAKTPYDERVEGALARVPKIAEAVAAIRELSLKHPVPATVQNQQEFKHYLDVEVAKELPPEKAAASVKALVRIGLLRESIDLGKTVENAMVTQAGAYYDPDTKRFYIVLVPEDPKMLDVMSAHELTHALDDEYFDLAAYTDDPEHKLSSDAQQARRFVAEGEATLVMIAYQTKVVGHQDIFAPKNRAMARLLVTTFAELDSEKVAQAAAESPEIMAQMGPELKASIEAMSSIPPFILDPLFGAYTKGAAAVAMVRDAGGWAAVADLYKTPPESTEQMLHPADKLIAKRDHPVAITFAPLPKVLAGWTELDNDVAGELVMGVYFKNLRDPAPASQVTGWGGDRYVAYASGDKVVGCWMTTWDTPKDAARFFAAYEASFEKRFGKEKAWSAAGAKGTLHEDGSVTAAILSGKDVAIVDGAEAPSAGQLFTWLAHSTKNKPQ